MSNLRELQPVFLLTLGRCGSRLLHGFFEGHPQVVTFPQSFNPYNCFHLSQKWRHDPEKWAQHLLSDFSNLRWAYQRHVTKGFGDFSHFKGDGQLFCQSLQQNLSMQTEAKDFFFHFHQAYLDSLPQPQHKLTHLISHIHNQKYLAQIQRDFPQAKWMVIVRDLRTMLHSHFEEQLQKCHQSPLRLSQMWNLSVHKALDALIAFENLRHQVGDQHFRYVRLEDLHHQEQQTVQSVAQWLGLSPDPSLLQSTLGGSLYSFTPRVKVAKKKNHFTEQDYFYLEKIFEKSLRQLNYPLRFSAPLNQEQFLRQKWGGERATFLLKTFVLRPGVEDLGPQGMLSKQDPINWRSVKLSLKKIIKDGKYLFHHQESLRSKQQLLQKWAQWQC